MSNITPKIHKFKTSLLSAMIISCISLPTLVYADDPSNPMCLNNMTKQATINSCSAGCGIAGAALVPDLWKGCIRSCVFNTSGCPRTPMFSIGSGPWADTI